jgi:hypothetical protein
MTKVSYDEIVMFQKYIYDFLQSPDIQLLVLTGSSSGMLQPMHSFPSASSRSKSCYFIRKTAEPVTKENFRNVLIFGDVAAKPVDQLAVLVQEVCLFHVILFELTELEMCTPVENTYHICQSIIFILLFLCVVDVCLLLMAKSLISFYVIYLMLHPIVLVV